MRIRNFFCTFAPRNYEHVTMLGIIINPKSGKRAFRAQRLYLWKLLKQRHQPFTYRVTKYANHATELARELVEAGYDEILVLGGDGTLSETLNGIMRANITAEQRAKICLGLMPRGTGNDWGRYWKLTRNYRTALDRFFHGTAHPIDVGCLTYYRNGIEHHRYFINSIGFGIDSLCCKLATDLKPYIGSHHVNYFFGLLMALLTHKPTKMQIVADGVEVANESLFTMNIANGPYSGGGIQQNPTADPTDGVFQSIFVQPPTFKDIIHAVPRLFNGKLTDLGFVHSFAGKDIEINTRTHQRIEADGILLDFIAPCSVHCIKHAVRFRV